MGRGSLETDNSGQRGEGGLKSQLFNGHPL